MNLHGILLLCQLYAFRRPSLTSKEKQNTRFAQETVELCARSPWSGLARKSLESDIVTPEAGAVVANDNV